MMLRNFCLAFLTFSVACDSSVGSLAAHPDMLVMVNHYETLPDMEEVSTGADMAGMPDLFVVRQTDGSVVLIPSDMVGVFTDAGDIRIDAGITGGDGGDVDLIYNDGGAEDSGVVVANVDGGLLVADSGSFDIGLRIDLVPLEYKDGGVVSSAPDLLVCGSAYQPCCAGVCGNGLTCIGSMCKHVNCQAPPNGDGVKIDTTTTPHIGSNPAIITLPNGVVVNVYDWLEKSDDVGVLSWPSCAWKASCSDGFSLSLTGNYTEFWFTVKSGTEQDTSDSTTGWLNPNGTSGPLVYGISSLTLCSK